MTKISKIQHLTKAKQQTICVDGLKFNLSGFIPDQSAKFRHIKDSLNLEYMQFGGNRNFKSNIKVHYKGQEVGRIDAHPKSSILKPDLVLFEAKNRLFYSQNWTKTIIKVFELLELKFNHINQIDLAVDVLDNDYKAFNFVHKLANGTSRAIGRTVWTPTYQGYTPNGKPKLRNLNFGSKGSDKFMRCYYKRQELEISNKHYIREFWENNNFELKEGGEVARFEIVIKKKELDRYKDVSGKFGDLNFENFNNLENVEYLATLFNTAQNKFFQFISSYEYKKYNGDASRCKKKTVVNLNNLTSYLLAKIRSKTTTLVRSAKITIKTLYLIYCKTDDDLIYRQISDLIDNFNLNRWFINACDRFYREFQAKLKSKEFEYLKSYTSTPTFLQSKIYNVTAGFN